MSILIQEEQLTIQIVEDLDFAGLVADSDFMVQFVEANGSQLSIISRLQLLLYLIGL